MKMERNKFHLWKCNWFYYN